MPLGAVVAGALRAAGAGAGLRAGAGDLALPEADRLIDAEALVEQLLEAGGIADRRGDPVLARQRRRRRRRNTGGLRARIAVLRRRWRRRRGARRPARFPAGL